MSNQAKLRPNKQLTPLILRTAAALTLFLAASGLMYGSSSRAALVIGNGNYEHTTRLANPVNDARDVAAALGEFGFSVTLVTDATAGEMERAIREFSDSVSSAGTETALFYYAGHGIQYEGVNYLVPVNADIRESYELLDKAVSMDRVSNGLDRAGSAFNLYLLDACRDNPFFSSRSASRGLSVMGAGGRGNMVVFATSPGNVALDGSGRNSPFTSALLEHLQMPNLGIRDLITEVQRTVQVSTGGRQIPWVNTSFTGEFYFRTAEEQLQESREELGVLEDELAALEREIAEREAAIAASGSTEEKRRLELEQQRAKALEESKRLEAQRLSELEEQAQEVLASRQAQEALRAEMEARLSAQQEELSRQAAERRADLEQLQGEGRTADDLRSRLETIAQLNRAIAEIGSRYEEITEKTLSELDGLHRQRVSAYRENNPRDPWETAGEHEQRIGAGLEALQEECELQRREQEAGLTARLERELVPLEEQLQQAKSELDGMRFRPGSEATAVEVNPFNAEQKRFPITLRVADSSISYAVPLSYAIESQDRDVIREEYYRVFSAYESEALVGRAEYAVYELEADVWGVFPLRSEVVNLLEGDAVLISSGTGEASVRIGSPLVLFTAKERVTMSKPASDQFRDMLLVTGLPPGAVLDNGMAQATAAGDRLLLKLEQRSYVLSADSRWFAEPLRVSVNREQKPDDLVWVDFSRETQLIGEFLLPRTDLEVSVSPEAVSTDQPYPASQEQKEGLLYRLDPGVYAVSYRLPEDRYDAGSIRIEVKPGQRYTYDPGEVQLSLPYRQELKLDEREEVERRIGRLPGRQALSFGLIGSGAAGAVASYLSYLKYADSVERYDAAELTEDAQRYRQEANLWGTLFTVSIGIGAGGSAAGGYLAVTAPGLRDKLEGERENIERQIAQLNAEAAARKAEEARDAFMESGPAGLTEETAAGWYSEELQDTADYTPVLLAQWEAMNYAVGDTGPAGGIIFYDKGRYSDGWRYLEAAPYGWYNGGSDPKFEWGGYGTIVGTSTGTETEKANTDKIIAKLGAGTYAAEVCADYSVTVNSVLYGDWLLPSKDELNQMYQNLHIRRKGGLSPYSFYWSSSESSGSDAWLQDFQEGSQYLYYKNFECSVRPIRAF
jgi:hypothetical protein